MTVLVTATENGSAPTGNLQAVLKTQRFTATGTQPILIRYPVIARSTAVVTDVQTGATGILPNLPLTGPLAVIRAILT